MGKNLEGSGRGLIEALSRIFWEGLRKIAKHVGIAVSRRKFEPNISRMLV
jgi:hypothetical protein